MLILTGAFIPILYYTSFFTKLSSFFWLSICKLNIKSLYSKINLKSCETEKNYKNFFHKNIKNSIICNCALNSNYTNLCTCGFSFEYKEQLELHMEKCLLTKIGTQTTIREIYLKNYQYVSDTNQYIITIINEIRDKTNLYLFNSCESCNRKFQNKNILNWHRIMSKIVLK